MLWQWSPSVIAEMAASAGLLVIAIYFPWRNFNRRAGFFGSSLLLTCALWVLSHAFEIGLPDPLYKSYLMGAQLIWGTIAVTFWLLYIVHFIGLKRWLATRTYVLFGIIPLLEILAVGTNHLHGLFWSKPGLNAHNPYLPLEPVYGIIYWICMAYVFTLTLAGSLLLIRNVVRLHHGRARESGGLVVAAVLPMLAALAIGSAKEIVLERGGGQRTFNLSVSAASDPEGHSPSKVVLLADITYRKIIEEKLRQGAEQLQNALKAIIESISRTTEIRDPYTGGHQKRVAQLSLAIAGEMGLSKDKTEALQMAAVIHDIGKLIVPAEILSKPGKLNTFEFDMLKQHPQAGFDILKDIAFPWPIAQIVFQHHERANGSGHPSGLSGEAILIEARILAVADVVEAMASNRPYRPALGIEKAMEEIGRNKGAFYDSDVVEACTRLFMEKGFSLKD